MLLFQFAGATDKQNYTATTGGVSSTIPLFPNGKLPSLISPGGIDRTKYCFIASIKDSDGNPFDKDTLSGKYVASSTSGQPSVNLDHLDYHGVGYDPRESATDDQTDPIDGQAYPRTTPIVSVFAKTLNVTTTVHDNTVQPTSGQTEYLVTQDIYVSSSPYGTYTFYTQLQMSIICALDEIESIYRPRELNAATDVANLDSAAMSDALAEIDDTSNNIDQNDVITALKSDVPFVPGIWQTQPSYYGLYANADLNFVLDDIQHYYWVENDLHWLDQKYFNNSLLSYYNTENSTSHATLADVKVEMSTVGAPVHDLHYIHLKHYTDYSATISYNYKRTPNEPYPREIGASYRLYSSANVAFPKIIKDMLYNGGTFYDCFYLVNHNSETITDLKLIPAIPKYGALSQHGVVPSGITLELGYDPAGIGDGVNTGVAQTLPDNTTPPSGVTFSSEAIKNGISMGQSQRIAVWMKITTAPKTLLYSQRYNTNYDSDLFVTNPTLDNHFSFEVEIRKKVA